MIKILATGSKGNCYLIQAGDEKLLLECGITWNEILKGLDFNIKGILGCLISHEHKDHSKSYKKIIKNGIDVYTSKGTLAGIGNTPKGRRDKIIKASEKFKIGNFNILPFEIEHDAFEPLGFIIGHPKLGKILFATDTYYLKYKFKNIDHILIECNYSEKILHDLEPHRARVLKSHMSLETLVTALKTWDLSRTKDIILIHISDKNGDSEEFKKEIESITGIKTIIAAPGTEI
ncbi:MBL fold metallo-hydrolase [Clostridium septicum]|uniref:MBL fold metallo-hydrolase n=1 Tax=Clostridium septicum TaxID=1504 RepID=A0A9N7JN89_CLOSE|nr:MBL fold metallo-hydrolase [Clostridium septicum]AYE35284.1 MBL fold metallo-hydrolase [Clostridium septicum]MDU1313912.1 MBL fold metallo-hydrolase [Clostridium septicum]QAS60678.1 MBL fold metallo-hydrolase [Clostridium septicum]UEC20064.1 MBL fold metallo-hydrolase [Clostridium septicum]USS01880.1 MBL fold metallo-hydrolase [Clostridium septicum]